MADTDNAPVAPSGGLWSGSELSPANSGLSITNQRAAHAHCWASRQHAIDAPRIITKEGPR